jgi:hypothetical protein
MDLEKIIDDLVYRKKNQDLDSPEYQLINRILTGLRYSYEERWRHHRGSGPVRVGRYLSFSRGITRDRAAASPAVPTN